MDAISILSSTTPKALLGRDPRSLVTDVLDFASQDLLHAEMRALDLVVAPHAALLPVGRAGVLTAEMTPLLCSVMRDEVQIPELLRHVHRWVSGLGDVTVTAREVEAARCEARLVVGEYGLRDGDSLDALPSEDREAVERHRRLDRATTCEVRVDDWILRLRIHDHNTLSAVVSVDGMRAIVGIAHVDQDGDSGPVARLPELIA